MHEQVFRLLDEWKDEYTAVLKKWVSVPSLKAGGHDQAPFGHELRRMLDIAMEDCRFFGLETREYDGYCGEAILGTEKDALAVLAHLDVVPAGDGWETQPFEPVIRDGRMYGRGTGDDKGPALCALFAMRAIREAGIPLKRSIRLILGCDEESGSEDIAYYKTKTVMPRIGFSPDASFPLINTEKAMIQVRFHAPLAKEGLQVLEMRTGERVNVIPGLSTCLVEGGEDIVEAVRAWSEKTGLPATAEKTDRGVCLTTEGIPGHSAYPEGRRNAIGMMLLLLRDLGVQGPLRKLADLYGLEHDGASLGIACHDDLSGALTCNMGILHVEQGTVRATLDNRVPVKADLDRLESILREKLSGFVVDDLHRVEPHHVPPESELVTCLLGAYHDLTGLDPIPESTGGGTYAKELEEGVAFGANFPGDPDLAHQANEYVDLDKMILTAKIYAEALLRLCAR